MSELLEQQMRQLKLGGMAKEWRSIEFHDIEQYVGELLSWNFMSVKSTVSTGW